VDKASQGLNQQDSAVDKTLLESFQREIGSKVPHVEEGGTRVARRVVNATPLIDITKDLKECAREEFRLDLEFKKGLKVFGKFDSRLPTGSIKVRPAVNIIYDAIAKGKLRCGQPVFEATSGNFGIALGQLKKIGLDVIALVSRRLQEGVFEELKNEGIRIINLDMDICPAPGMMKSEANLLAAKAVASNIRWQLSEYGFDSTIFDKSQTDIERLLAAQDIINLAKLLARIYNGFCPEQYDNEMNLEAHRTVTAEEVDQQLQELGSGYSLAEFKVACTFGTGGTSGGFSRYMMEKYGRKSLHVVFPLGDQDVAGIRTKGKATGLKFYEPTLYAGQHEVDFRQAKRLLKYFVEKKGRDIGESSALALYAVMQIANSAKEADEEARFVVLIADGSKKYKKSIETSGEKHEESSDSIMKEGKDLQKQLQISLQEALPEIENYDRIIWIHTMYTPRKEGIQLIAKSLGVEESKIVVPKASEVGQLLATQQIPKSLDNTLRGGGEKSDTNGRAGGKALLVCMMGNTSLRVAEVLAKKGIVTQSLNGGISTLSQGKGKQISELVKMATE
jgi:cysteine synthase A